MSLGGKNMLSKFYPDLIVDSIKDIKFDFLKAHRISGLILDIDNTLVATHTAEADETLVEWINNMQNNGIELCIVSNASLKRVTLFNKKINIHAIHRAYKPSPKGFLLGAERMHLLPSQVAMVGDQIFTDIYGGKKAGMKTILVKPIDPREILFVKLKRFPERLILNSYYKKRGLNGQIE
jgi:uncharacterized protein